jgi:hypothetical protein
VPVWSVFTLIAMEKRTYFLLPAVHLPSSCPPKLADPIRRLRLMCLISGNLGPARLETPIPCSQTRQPCWEPRSDGIVVKLSELMRSRCTLYRPYIPVRLVTHALARSEIAIFSGGAKDRNHAKSSLSIAEEARLGMGVYFSSICQVAPTAFLF